MSTKKAALSDGLILERCAADYTPTFPRKKDSVTAETLARLLDGQTITQREAYDRLSTVNIARTIFDLRRYGWPVITTDELPTPATEESPPMAAIPSPLTLLPGMPTGNTSATSMPPERHGGRNERNHAEMGRYRPARQPRCVV